MDSAQSDNRLWVHTPADGPILATALHAGHIVRDELLPYYELDGDSRLREEDPGTDLLASAIDNRLVLNVSRFEMDLNRPREKTVYLAPADAWNLTVWKERPPANMLERTLANYDEFYRTVYDILAEMHRKHGRILVLDFHSYNHRRNGPAQPPSPQEGNPDIDVEIDAIGRSRWHPIVETLVESLRACGHDGRPADVRESIRFRAGHFVNWVQKQFPETCCAIAIEFKKTYMNEWTGEINYELLRQWRESIRHCLPQFVTQLRVT